MNRWAVGPSPRWLVLPNCFIRPHPAVIPDSGVRGLDSAFSIGQLAWVVYRGKGLLLDAQGVRMVSGTTGEDVSGVVVGRDSGRLGRRLLQDDRLPCVPVPSCRSWIGRFSVADDCLAIEWSIKDLRYFCAPTYG